MRSIDTYFLEIAKVVSTRSTCVRRQVGCVLVDKHKHILATGYNGTPRGMPHCTDAPCPGANYESGTGLDKCRAIHAETNALIQCSDTETIEVVYVTISPCMNCAKILMNTSAKLLVFKRAYTDWDEVKDFWVQSGRRYLCIP